MRWEIQEELKDRNKELPESRRMEVRMGINLGDVVEEGDNILGDGVNVAARVQSLADPGGISISGTAYDHVKNKLALGYEFLGGADCQKYYRASENLSGADGARC